jgi:iron complex outermembrane recepter protein
MSGSEKNYTHKAPLCRAFSPFYYQWMLHFRFAFCLITSLFFTNNCLFSQKNLADTLLLQTVVIQANRAKEKAAVPHNNFDAAQIAQNNQAQDMPYLLRSVPSLIESSDAGNGVGYTGVRIRGSDPTRVNVTINGVPLNDAESQGVYWVNLPDLAASASEVQVQRGVGNSTSGVGAFGANINVDISKVETEAAATVVNTFGSFGTRKHSLQANTGLLQNHWTFSGRASKINSNGYIDRAKVNLDALHFSAAYTDDNQTFMVHFLSGHEVTYQAWNGVPAQYIDIPALRTYNSSGAEKPNDFHKNEVDDYTQKHTLGHYNRKLNPKTSLQINANYTKGAGFYEQYKTQQDLVAYLLTPFIVDSEYVEKTDLIRRRWLDNTFVTTTALVKYQPLSTSSKLQSFTFGTSASRYKGRHYGEVIWFEKSNVFADNYLYYNDLADKNDFTFFSNVEYKIAQKLRTFVDLQLRKFSYNYQGFSQNNELNPQKAEALFFNPKLSFVYDLSFAKSVYLYTGVAHREPNRDDFQQSSAVSRPKSERLLDVELGFKNKMPTAFLNVNLFGMWYKNQLVLNGKINDVGAYARINVPKSFRTGVEIEASKQWSSKFNINGNLSLSSNKVVEFFNYTDNWDIGGQNIEKLKYTDLAYSPNVSSYLAMNYDLFKAKKQAMSSALIVKYVGSQYLDNSQNSDLSLPQYTTVDLKLNYLLKNIFTKETTLTLVINNILNKKYSSNAWSYRYISDGYDATADNVYTRKGKDGSYNQTGFFPQAGTNWLLSLNCRF